MAGIFEFSVSTSGTLLPNGETVSGSTLVNYTEYFQYDVRTSITDFQIPASGNTSYSGINPSYVTPISGTAPILFQPAEWLELDYQLNTYTFTISGEPFISYHGDDNSSEEYATCDMTGWTSPSPCRVSSSYNYSSYYGWEAFDRNESNYWYGVRSGNWPARIYFDFGTDNDKIINKYRIYERYGDGPTDWLFQGVKDGVTSPSVTDDDDWETIHEVTSYAWSCSNCWSDWFTFTNSKAYQYYRFKFTAGRDYDDLRIGEIHLVEFSDIVYKDYTVLGEFDEGTKLLLLRTNIYTPLIGGYNTEMSTYPSYQSETASGTYINLAQKLNNSSYISQVGLYSLFREPFVTSTDYATIAMVSNTSPSPNLVAATSIVNASYPAWKAFDRDNSDYYCWYSAYTLPASIMYDFGAGNEKCIVKYRFQARNYSDTHAPKSWYFQGSNESSPNVSNDSHWTTLDSRSNISNPGQNNWSDWFYFDNTISYRAYRFKAIDSHTPSCVAIGELHLVAFTYPLIPSVDFKVAQKTSVSGFTLTTLNSGVVDISGENWISLDQPYVIPDGGDYYTGVYSDDILWAFSRPFIGKNSARIEGNVEGDCSGVIRSDDYVSVGVRYAPKYNIGTIDTTVVIADGSLNTSEEYATCTMVGNTSPSPCRVSYTYSYSSYYGWEAFDRNESNYWWGVYNNWPQSIYFYFGAGGGKVINKYRIYDVSNYGPTTWLFQGNKDGVHEPGVGDDDDWETLHTISGYSWSGSDCWSDWFTLVNTDSYEFYRFKFLEGKNSSRMCVGEIHLVEAQYQPVAGQEFFQDFYLASTSLSGATYLSVSNNTLSTSGSVYLTTNTIQPDVGGLIDLELTVYEPLYTTVSSTTSGYIFKGYNRYTYHDIGHDTLVTEPLLLFTTRSGYTELSDSMGAYNEGIPSTNYNEYLYDSTDRYELQGTNLVRITAASGAMAELNIDDLTDLEVHDLKGTIYQWDQYDETWGRFETVGGAAVSLGAGNTNEFIQPGLLVITASGKHYIRQISGDGTAVDGVELDRALPDITISGIYGLDTYSLVVGTTTVTGFDMPNLDGSVNTSTDYATCDMTGYDTPEPCRVEDSDHYSSYYGWEAFDRNTGNYWYTRYTEPPFSILFDFGAGNETVINKYQIFCPYSSYPISAWELQGVVSGMQNPDVSDDAHWETVHSGSKIGSWGGWSGYYTFTGAPYQIYRLKINEVYDDGPQYYTRVSDIQLVSAGRYGAWSTTTSGLYVAHTNDSTQLDTSLWASINGLEVLDSTLGSGLAYHAISFDERQTWKVFKDSDWRDIARDDSGTWKYLTTTGWAVAPENTGTRALYEAFSLAENQVVGTEWEDLTSSDWVSVSGFTTSVTTIDVAFALQQVTDEIPWVNLYRFDYTTTTTSSYYTDYNSYNLYLFDSTISGGYSFHLLPLTTQMSGTLDIEVIGRQIESTYMFCINDDPETSYNIKYCTTGMVGPQFDCLGQSFTEDACNIGSSLNVYLYKIMPYWLWSIIISHPSAISVSRLLSRWQPFDHSKIPIYDLYPPKMCSESNPVWGTNMLDPYLEVVSPDSDKGKVRYITKEDVSEIFYGSYTSWIKRQDRGYQEDVVYDHFSFHSQDLKASSQHGEWHAINTKHTDKFFINEKFEKVSSLDNTFLHPKTQVLDIKRDNDVFRKDYKGDIYWWRSDLSYYGHFEDESGNILTLGSGNQWGVLKGMEVDTIIGDFQITSISGNGNGYKAVTLSSGINLDYRVYGIYSVIIEDGFLTVRNFIEADGANNTRTDYATCEMFGSNEGDWEGTCTDGGPSGYRANGSSYFHERWSHPYGKNWAWKAFNRRWYDWLDEGYAEVFGTGETLITPDNPGALAFYFLDNPKQINKFRFLLRRSYPWPGDGNNKIPKDHKILKLKDDVLNPSTGKYLDFNDWDIDNPLREVTNFSCPISSKTPFYTFVNPEPLRGICMYVTDMVGDYGTEFLMQEIQFVEADSAVVGGVHVAITSNSSNFKTEWYDDTYRYYVKYIKQIIPIDILEGESKTYYGVSFDNRSTWKIFKDEEWYSVATTISGVWNYRNTTSGWTIASGNDMLSALKNAFESGNYMNGTDVSYVSLDEWGYSGGYDHLSTKTIDFAIGLEAGGRQESPFFDKFYIDYYEDREVLEVDSCYEDVVGGRTSCCTLSGTSHLTITQPPYIPFEESPVYGRFLSSGIDNWELETSMYVYRDSIVGQRQWAGLMVLGYSVPPSRGGHTMNYDYTNNSLIIIGGRDSYSYYSDVWTFDIGSETTTKSKTYEYVTPTYNYTLSGISPRADHSAVYCDSSYPDLNISISGFSGVEYISLTEPYILVFGGQSNNRLKDDLYAYSITDKAWFELQPSGNLPSARYGHTAVLDSYNKDMFIFGGQTSSGVVNDVYRYNIGNNNWELITTVGNISPRRNHTSLYVTAGGTYNGDIISFGGTCSGQYFNDLIRLHYNGTNYEWTTISSIGAPWFRAYHSMVYEPNQNEIFIIGGYYGKFGNEFSLNTSEIYATPDMTSYTSPAPCEVADSYHYSSYYGWEAFDRSTGNYWYGVRSGNWPARIYFDFGTGNDKIINKYRIYDHSRDGPTDWLFQGVKDGVTSPSVTDDDDWETIHEVTSYAWSCYNCWSDWFTFTNSKAYQYYRFKFTAGRDNDYLRIGEIHLVEVEKYSPFVINDVYKYDLDTHTWSELDITLSGTVCDHKSEYFTYNGNQYIMIFGGFVPDWNGFTESFQWLVKDGVVGDPWIDTLVRDTFLQDKHFFSLSTSCNTVQGNHVVRMDTNISGGMFLGNAYRSREDPGLIWLRLTCSGGMLIGSYSQLAEDWGTWHTIGTGTLMWNDQFSGDLFVGLFVSNDCAVEPYESTITANFDYIKLTGNGIRSIIEDEPWELIAEYGAGINTIHNTGYTQVIPNSNYDEFELIYQVNGDLPFNSNEVVCFRSMAYDLWNIRIPYMINSEVSLFISSDLQENMPVTTQVENQIIDLSQYNHRVWMVDDITLGESAYMRIKPSCQYLLTWNEDTSSWEVAFYVDGTNQQVITGSGYTLTPGTSFSNPEVYQGSGSIDFVTSSGYVSVELSEHLALDSSEWTVDFWIYPLNLSSYFPFFGFWSNQEPHMWQLLYWYDPSNPEAGGDPGIFLTIKDESHFFGHVPTFAENEWVHIALVRKNGMIYSFMNGWRQQKAFAAIELPSSHPQGVRLGGPEFSGYIDLFRVVKGTALFEEFFNNVNRMDSVGHIKIAGYDDLTIYFNIAADKNSPKLIDVTPSRNIVDFCPVEPIVFDILDDFSGVNLDKLNIMIDGDLVLEEGINKDVEFDRGTLTWVTRGQLDGEWFSCGTQEYISATNSGIPTCFCPSISGINRELYPPGTVYSGSGAWGYRFTYQFKNGELPYDHDILIMAWGEDLYGSSFYLDSIEPNEFIDSYNFQVITNKNIQANNFFIPLNQGQTVRTDTVLTVDLWDTNYPDTDLITESGRLVRSDCYKSTTYDGITCSGITCSGMWWTHWITSSGQQIHRLHYKPEDLFRWDGLRENVFEITIPTTYSACHVERTFTYKLRPGYQIYWDHEKYLDYPSYNQVWNQFSYGNTIPVFIAAKTTTFLPSELTYNCVFQITKEHCKDLTVTLVPKVIHDDLEVTLVADNYYLLYDEDVEVIVEAEDFVGNKMQYTFTFHTESNA